MPSTHKSRGTFRRVLGALVFAAALWGVAALSDTYVSTIPVPLRVYLPPDQALIEPVQQYIHVTLRADGWSLLKLAATGATETTLRPIVSPNQEERAVSIDRNTLLLSVRESITNVQQITSISPDSLTLVVGRVAQKRVPLFPDVVISTRPGFQVIGKPEIRPDSVTLTGSAKALEEITTWTTEPVKLEDIHNPIARRLVRVSDTLQGVARPNLQVAELSADVQEIAEQRFVEIPIHNRGSAHDPGLELVIEPRRVDVVIRGGVRDLSELNPKMLQAYIDVVQGYDTLGLARPRMWNLPPTLTVIRVEPDRVRYRWRRGLGSQAAR